MIDEVVSIGEYVCIAGILVMLLFLDGIKWLDLVAGSSLLSVHEEWASRRWVFVILVISGLSLNGWAWKHGGFVSHCGWGSTVEGIVSRVPIIVVPMVLDQLLNAKIVADIGVGMEVPREEIDQRVRKEELARVIKQVVVQEEGQQIRKKPKELSESMKKKGDGKAINVVEKLMQLVKVSSWGLAYNLIRKSKVSKQQYCPYDLNGLCMFVSSWCV
ncbi:hypothetical protein KPL70_024086 [Citrus sinensis]|nr:hypothetical protein KPL70_024086 [Citrus sinensis]